MKMFQSFRSTLKCICILGALSISNTGFAERNQNVTEACKQFKLSAAEDPTEEVTFKYYAGLPKSIFRTYYKGAGSIYYDSLADKQMGRAPKTPRGNISAQPLKNISLHEYEKFFAACNLIADDELLQFGFYLVEAGGDPVVAAKALQESEWFEITYPLFITGL